MHHSLKDLRMKPFLLLLCFCLPLSAQEQVKSEKLTVLIKKFPPLVIQEEGKYKGFDIDLWKEIAKRLQLETEFELAPFQEILDRVATEENVIGLGGITVTSKREKYVDFTHPYMTANLKALVSSDSGNFSYAKAFIIKISPTAAYLSVFILLCGHLLWISERGRDAINDKYCPGVFEGMWLTITTMTTVGYGDYAPQRWSGRAVSFVIMIVGITFYGWVVANMSNIMMNQDYLNKVSIEELRTAKFATSEKSTSHEFLKENGYKYQTSSSVKEAIFELYNKNVEAVVYDEPVLKYYLQSNPDHDLYLLGENLKTEFYGIAVPSKSPLREQINQALLTIREDGTWQMLHEKWLGKESTTD